MRTDFSHRSREIRRVDPPDVETFEREFRRPRRPAVLRGIVPLEEREGWSFNTMRADFEDLEVPTHSTRAGAVVSDPRRGVTTEPRPLGDVLGELDCAGPPSLYMMARVEELPLSWRDRVQTPEYCRGAPWLSRKLWLSPRGTVTMMHRDASDNVHLQLLGSKRFTLVTPEHGRLLYPNSWLSSMPNGCRVDIESPDFERYPLACELRTEQVDLAPGDGLYIPRGCWHHVRTIADSLSTNFWWARGLRLPLVAGTDLFKRLRGINR